jgi:N-methylhydantoinase A
VRFAVGVDIGGTFTDFVAYDYESLRFSSEKILTTPEHPAEAVIQGLTNLESNHSIRLNQIGKLFHATTLATNALIERNGARTGLITTSGFEDVLDIRKGMRYNQYDLKIQFPNAYVPRFLRRGVRERALASGQVLKKFSEPELVEAVSQLVEQGVNSIAVCFLHSYANPAHEKSAKEIIARHFPRLPVSISSEITPQAREYERMSTTVADAYVKPIIQQYLDELTKRLGQLEFGGKLLMMTCSGGMVDPQIARRIPVLLLESGPVAGVSISSQIGKLLGLKGIYSFDMGGTTAKGSLLPKGKIEKSYEFEAARVDKFRRGSGIPISIPTVRLIEIGSGGGSLARVDSLGIVRVGPESAGANPGPACYGLGGTRPTVTDSSLVLGYLDPEYFLGGVMKLKEELARNAVESNIAKRAGLSIEEAAWAVHEHVNENIAAAFRLHASEAGVDYRNYSFVCFGGAGPIHATRIARKLLATKVLIPPRAGVLSAEGLLVSPLSIDLAQTRRYELSDLAYETYESQFQEITDRASQILYSSGQKKDDLRITRSLDMCYHGQGFDVPVELKDSQPNKTEFLHLKELFEIAYKARYSISGLTNSIDVTSFKVTISARTEGDIHIIENLRRRRENSTPAARKKRRSAFDPDSMKYRNFEVIDRSTLRRSDHVSGPALIQEIESTTVLSSDCAGIVDRFGNVSISIEM